MNELPTIHETWIKDDQEEATNHHYPNGSVHEGQNLHKAWVDNRMQREQQGWRCIAVSIREKGKYYQTTIYEYLRRLGGTQ